MNQKESVKIIKYIFLKSFEGESQYIYDIKENKKDSCFDIITIGKTTAWKHSVKSEEIPLETLEKYKK